MNSQTPDQKSNPEVAGSVHFGENAFFSFELAKKLASNEKSQDIFAT